ncbi:hypothetical protein DFH11DRAFT_1508273 [Phellopilus nigrolimitatus]|nr:hypothetical protein DFH11DRAFT_1508273 [Phellopilus nigrolimitatus]
MAAVRRQEGNNPSFPASPASCPICSQNYANIDSCAAAAPVLANFSMVIFNPGAFIDVIKCSCTDTFRSAYPQCVDCFTQTNQTSFLSAPASELPDILTGIRNICALESTLLGNASAADGEASSSFAGTSTGVHPTSTLTSTAVRGMQVTAKPVMAMVYVTALGLTGIALCIL